MLPVQGPFCGRLVVPRVCSTERATTFLKEKSAALAPNPVQVGTVHSQCTGNSWMSSTEQLSRGTTSSKHRPPSSLGCQSYSLSYLQDPWREAEAGNGTITPRWTQLLQQNLFMKEPSTCFRMKEKGPNTSNGLLCPFEETLNGQFWMI